MSFPVNAAVICLARRRCDVIHAVLRNGTLNEEKAPPDRVTKTLGIPLSPPNRVGSARSCAKAPLNSRGSPRLLQAKRCPASFDGIPLRPRVLTKHDMIRGESVPV